MKYEGTRKDWGEVKQFVRERLVRATHDSDHTRLECLHAHYRRWCFFSNYSAIGESKFVERLQSITKIEPYEFRGHQMYAIEIKDLPPQVEDEAAEDSRPKVSVRGRVRVTKQIEFRDGCFKVGHELDWVEATPYEKQRLEHLSKDGPKDALSWLVVLHEGKRQFIPGASVQRVL